MCRSLYTVFVATVMLVHTVQARAQETTFAVPRSGSPQRVNAEVDRPLALERSESRLRLAALNTELQQEHARLSKLSLLSPALVTLAGLSLTAGGLVGAFKIGLNEYDHRDGAGMEALMLAGMGATVVGFTWTFVRVAARVTHRSHIRRLDDQRLEVQLRLARTDVHRIELQQTRALRAKHSMVGPLTLLGVGGLTLAAGLGGAMYAAAAGDRHDPSGFFLAVGAATVGLATTIGGAVWLTKSNRARRRYELKIRALENELTTSERRPTEATAKPHAQLRLTPLLSPQIAGANLSVTF